MNMEDHPLKQMFLARVSQDADGCWEWAGSLFKSGYGRLGGIRAHRLSWEIFRGDIPEGLLVCHHCDNCRCVRPDHLFVGTCADNHADRNRKGRQARGDRSGARTHPERLRRGEENWKSKLTSEQVLEIIRLYKGGGVTQQALGQMYGINNSHVSRLVRKENWKHLFADEG